MMERGGRTLQVPHLECSGDGALARPASSANTRAVSPESFRGCHRTPNVRKGNVLVAKFKQVRASPSEVLREWSEGWRGVRQRRGG
jgi:hypothetical protein